MAERRVCDIQDEDIQGIRASQGPFHWQRVLPSEGVNQEQSPLGTGESYPNERQREPGRTAGVCLAVQPAGLERSRADPPRKSALGDNKRGPINWAPDAGDFIEGIL